MKLPSGFGMRFMDEQASILIPGSFGFLIIMKIKNQSKRIDLPMIAYRIIDRTVITHIKGLRI